MAIEKRRRVWFAVYDVPRDVRPILGRSRFVATLKTGDRETALRRHKPRVEAWRCIVQSARAAHGLAPRADYSFPEDTARKVACEGETTFVYVLSAGRFSKVGIARDPEARRKEIQVGNPIPVEVSYSHPCRSREEALALEAAAHHKLALFDDGRAKGGREWFPASPTAAIAAIRSVLEASEPAS